MPVLTKINTNSIADDAVTAAKTAGTADAGGLGFGDGNLSGTISGQQAFFADAFTLTGDLTVNDDLVLGKVRDDGTGQSLTGDGKTLTGTGTLTMGSSFEGEPKNRTNERVTTLGSDVTGGSGLKNMTLHSSTWYIPATYTPSATEAIIVGWEESNADGYNRLGTAPTESSDVFTMPATGWYWVTLTTLTYQVSISSDTYSTHIQLSTDSGSSFDAVVISAHRHITDTAGEQTRSTTIQSIVKITNTTTDLIRLYGGGIKIANTQIAGGTQNTIGAAYATTCTFTKLADI